MNLEHDTGYPNLQLTFLWKKEKNENYEYLTIFTYKQNIQGRGSICGLH